MLVFRADDMPHVTCAHCRKATQKDGAIKDGAIELPCCGKWVCHECVKRKRACTQPSEG